MINGAIQGVQIRVATDGKNKLVPLPIVIAVVIVVAVVFVVFVAIRILLKLRRTRASEFENFLLEIPGATRVVG